MADVAGVDFVLAACRKDGRWQVELLSAHVVDDLDALVAVLRQRSGDGGALGLISVDEDFFVAVRVLSGDVDYLLSDVTAGSDWPLARTVIKRLGLPLPADEEQVQPAGDLAIFTDFGIESVTVAAVCDEIDWNPEDMLAELAEQMGFAPEYEAAVDAAYG